MLYEINKSNSLSLYHLFQEKGYQGNKNQFDKELFNSTINNYQRTYVYELEGQIIAYLQYGKINGNGYIRLFEYKDGFEYAAQEILFRCATYFYMFHLDATYQNFNTHIDEIYQDVNISKYISLFSEFNINLTSKIQNKKLIA